MDKERIIQGASVSSEGFDERAVFQKEEELEQENIENNDDNNAIEVQDQKQQDQKLESTQEQAGQEEQEESSDGKNDVLSNMKFQYCISEPISNITEEQLSEIYEEHLLWLEALLNPNKKVFRGRANLSGANLAGFKLDGLNFSGGSFVGTSFVGASLVGTNFTGADLSGADFSDAKFSNTKFKRAILNGAIFTNEEKEGIDISFASTVGTEWSKKEEDSEDNKDNSTDVGIDNSDTEIIDDSNNIEE